MTYTLTVSINLYHVALAAAGLLLFGLGYNHWLEGVEANGHDRGYMSLIVSLGCAVTVAAYALATNPWLALVLLAHFAASGTPMIVGSIRRYIHARAAEERERQRQALARLGEEA